MKIRLHQALKQLFSKPTKPPKPLKKVASARSRSESKKTKKSSWGGPRVNSGRRKRAPLPKLPFKLDTVEHVSEALDICISWFLSRRVDGRELAALGQMLSRKLKLLPHDTIKPEPVEIDADAKEKIIIEFIDSLPQKIQDEYVKYLRAKREGRQYPSPMDENKMALMILDQLPLAERDRVIEAARKQHLKELERNKPT